MTADNIKLGPKITLTPEMIEDSNAYLVDLIRTAGREPPDRGDLDAIAWHNLLVDILHEELRAGTAAWILDHLEAIGCEP